MPLAKSGAALYAIGMGTRNGRAGQFALLETLTTDTGGYVEPLRDPSDISAAVARICDELQSQYLLGFEPARADGNFHPIEVKREEQPLESAREGGLCLRNKHSRARVAAFTFYFPTFDLQAQQPLFRSDIDRRRRAGDRHRSIRSLRAGLTAADFELSDGGTRREITQFSTERVPVSLGILLDISGSMATDAKARALDDARWADTRRALELLVQRLDPRDEVLFAAFADRVGLAVPWTRDHQRVPRAFNTLRPGGYTALFDAVRLIAPAFQRAEHARKVLLVISDGRDSLVPRVSGAPVYRYPLSREQQVQSEIYTRQKALRDAAVGAAQRVVKNSGAALYADRDGDRERRVRRLGATWRA